ETVLLHILRGSGTRGLRGLLPLSRLRTGAGEITVIRPLLEMRRRDTIAYCQSQHLRPRVDTTNTSPEFLRNRIRHELIPVLERYNPEVVSALLRTASIARSDYDFIESELDRRWEGTVFLQDGAAVIDRKGFSGLPETLRRYLLCRAIERVRGDLRDIEASHIEDLLEMAEKPAGKTLELPGGLRFITGHDRYTLAPEKHLPSPLPPLEGEAPLNVPGKTLYCGWEITAEVMPRGRVDDVFTADGLTALLDADRLSCPLTVRPRRPGDRFQPLGTEGSKKVSRFMADAHVPRHLRGVVPLLAAPQGIVWVVGYRIDGRFRLTDGTLKVLRVTFRRI
ncbi:MAG: tRNA lysidine(34) synthetase TilS, partial [Dehalococcoidales bacterium]|nr:tRNA lysidine(34) synthetase TilS [Dehalococcoidales bacterium]